MNDLTSLPKEVLEKLQLLADKLGVSIQFVYEQLVKDNTRLGLIGIVTSIFVVLVCVAAFWVGYCIVPKMYARIHQSQNLTSDGKEAARIAIGIISGAFALVLFITTACTIYTGVEDAKRFAAPNKYTIEDIRDLLHGNSLTGEKVK